jgi:hypothetical protein
MSIFITQILVLLFLLGLLAGVLALVYFMNRKSRSKSPSREGPGRISGEDGSRME